GVLGLDHALDEACLFAELIEGFPERGVARIQSDLPLSNLRTPRAKLNAKSGFSSKVGDGLAQRSVLINEAHVLGFQKLGGFHAYLDDASEDFCAATNLGILRLAGFAQGFQGQRPQSVQGLRSRLPFLEVVTAKLRDETRKLGVHIAGRGDRCCRRHTQGGRQEQNQQVGDVHSGAATLPGNGITTDAVFVCLVDGWIIRPRTRTDWLSVLPSPGTDQPQANSLSRTLPSRNNCMGRPVRVISSWCGSIPRLWNKVAAMSSGVHASVAGATP